MDTAPERAPALLPADHPQRRQLNDEAHARPPQQLVAPARLSYLAMLSDGEESELHWQHVLALCDRFDADVSEHQGRHFVADLGAFRLTYERHTEFVRYNFIVDGLADRPFAETAIDAVPQDWLAELPGQLIMAAHVIVCAADACLPSDEERSNVLFAGNPLIGSSIAAGAGTAWTDFRVHDDGFSRWLVRDDGMTPRQCGRSVQRLLEIDTYRLMAMLALPLANELTPQLARSERELERITQLMSGAGERDERALLERLTMLQTQLEERASASAFRFDAARAYHALVQRRVVELREQRLPGLQTFNGFVERRLAPAMQTCSAVSQRQASLIERAARATALLSTRVDVIREEHTQALLESMDRRARLQLRLQQTVEGLSVAAITYYVVGLVSYAAKGMETAELPVNAPLVTGISIPLVFLAVAMGVRRVRKAVTHDPS